MPVEPFATIDDYERRWGNVADAAKCIALLADASDFIACELERSGKDVAEVAESRALTLQRITCRIVHEQLGVPDDMFGVSQTSMTAGPYTQQWSWNGGTSGAPMLLPSEKRQLGIGRMRVGSVPPRVWGSEDGG